MKSFYVTTPIYYASGAPHIGHAYTNLITDIIARYYRMKGVDVRFLTGTDEHGQKVYKKAQEEGVTPQAYVDATAAVFQRLTEVWNISNDDFIRTTEDRHKASVAAFWQKVMEAGYIYKQAYSGLYCVGCEAFKTEKDLVDGKCPDHDLAPEQLEEENYFFKLSAFEDELKELFAAQDDFVMPSDKANEMRQILNDGLEDISISRSADKLPWGIPVPGDDGQVLYVWFDALVNYISALGFGRKGSDMMHLYWPGVHIVGKEINRFHSLLWPAMLMAAGLKPPAQVAVHGWITVDGKKMSKTIGNVLDPFEIVEQYTLEATRYIFAREVPFYRDGDFSHERAEMRYNNDLANELGNLLNRAVAMTDRYLGGEIPAVVAFDDPRPVWTAYHTAMEAFRFDEALDVVWKQVRKMNKYIDEKEPWKLGKLDDKTDVSEVLYVLLESLRQIAWMILPVMPVTAERIFEQIGTSFGQQVQMTLFEASEWGKLSSGGSVHKGDPLFPRIEREEYGAA